ncbi:MAG: hypothetical protein ACK5LK_10630 [Chthoniobacterales bacterium]
MLSRNLLIVFFLAVVMHPAKARAVENKPIALVGASYGKYDTTSITRNILDASDWVFENRDGLLPVNEWSRYSLVIIAHSQKRPYTVEEQAQIEQYLKDGGRLLLLNQAPRSMADDESAEAQYEWLGMKQRKILAHDPEEISLGNDAVLKGVAGEKRPSWLTGDQGVSELSADVEVLIGSGNTALVAKRVVGNGVVYYLGPELFRLRLPRSPYVADSDSYVRLIRNIISESHPDTHAAWKARLVAEHSAKGERFLLWNREWQHGTKDRTIFEPPLPTSEEKLEALDVPLALDEFEALQVNFTDLGDGGELSWKVEGLPAGLLTVFVQDKPAPIPWPKNPAIAMESPYWLMPPTALEPLDKEAVKITSGETRIFWLKFDTHNQMPHDYEGRITFSVDGATAGEIKLNAKLNPLRVPKRRQITLQAAGTVYGDVNKVPTALRFMRNLEENGFEWALLNVIRAHTLLLDGQPLSAAVLKQNLDAILSDSPPLLDCSAMDAFVDASLTHNQTYFRAATLVKEIDALCRAAKLSDEETQKTRRWYLNELASHLKDKGIRYFFVSLGDELSAKELENVFLPFAKTMADGGWMTTSSFSTPSVSEIDRTRKLAKYVGAWTLNRQFLSRFRGWQREGKLKLPDGALVGTYGAGEGRGTEIRKNASTSRMIGWEAVVQGSDYCSPNPYFKGWLYYTDYSLDRGIGGERFVAYLDAGNPEVPLLNSPFLEGIRESLEEANLAWAMNWYLEKLGDRVPSELRQRAANIIGDRPENPIKLKVRDGALGESETITADREGYLKAKAEVLDILNELAPLAEKSGVVPDVDWNHLPLLRGGKPVAVIVEAESADSIQTALQTLAGYELPVEKEKFPARGTVLFVGTSGSPLIPQNIKARLGRHAETASWIRDISDGDRTVIWIGGTDQEQVKKAVQNFVRFLKAPAAVF